MLSPDVPNVSEGFPSLSRCHRSRAAENTDARASMHENTTPLPANPAVASEGKSRPIFSALFPSSVCDTSMPVSGYTFPA
jgi:hypothetical protein